MKIEQNVSVIFSLLLAVFMSTCSSKRKGQCFSCFNSLSSVQQIYLDSNQATFDLAMTLDPDSTFKAVLAQSKDLVDTVEKANLDASSDDVSIISDWSPVISLAFLEGLLPDQTYALALLERNKFDRIRIMEIKEFSTQSAASPKAGGIPKVMQVKKEEATIVFPSAIDDTTKSSEMSYLVAVWKKGLGYSTKEAILENSAGIAIAQDWAQGTNQEHQEIHIGALEVETDYVVGILARDIDGNTTLLPLRSLRTLDQSAPDADVVSLASTTDTSATLTWPEAQDQETSADRLEYKVLSASSLTSLENPELLNLADGSSFEPKVLQDWTPNLRQYEATGLTVGIKYHVTVIVRDLGKNLAVYRTLTIVLPDPDAPVFDGDTIELKQYGTMSRYLDGVSVVTQGTVGYVSSLATDKTTPADQMEYLAACSLDPSALATLESIDNNPSKVTKSAWIKAVSKKTAYSITLISMDPEYIPYCAGNRLEMMGNALWYPSTPELQNLKPSTFYNICSVLKNYEIDPVNVMKPIGTYCLYSGVSGKIYGTVFARDVEGKTVSLGPKLLAYTWDTDAPRFTADPTLDTDDILSWTAASDFFTPRSKIEYKVVAAVSAESVDTLDEVAAITTVADGLVMNWTPNITSTAINVALTGSSYNLVVAARDELGNVRLAKTVSLQDAAPTSGVAPTFSDFVFNSLLLSWGTASDDKTIAANLYYKVVRADAAADIDTIAEANARSSSDVLLDWTKATTSLELTGSQLAIGSFAVLVKDSVGQMALHAPVSRTQSVDSIQLYFDSGNAASYPGTGTIWNDLSGNGFHSTMLGGLAYLSSDGGVMDFDGIDDYVLLGDLSAIKPTTTLSISMWLAPDNWTAPGLTEAKSAISCSQAAGYAVNLNTTNRVQFQIWVNGAYKTAFASTVGFTGWKHVTGVFDGRYVKMYINGALIHTVDAGATYPAVYISNGVLLGAEATGNNTPHTANWWAGKIGPSLIRSLAMTDAEVLAEFNATKARFGL